MSNEYERLSKVDRKKLMKNYIPDGKRKGYFVTNYNYWKRLSYDKGDDTNMVRWKNDNTGFLWAVEQGTVIEGGETIRLDPYDAQSQEILASGAPASAKAVNRGNASQGRRGKKSTKTGKIFDTISQRNRKGRFGRYIPRTPAYENQPRYKGQFITREELEKIGQLSVNRTLPPSKEREKQNRQIKSYFNTPRTQPSQRNETVELLTSSLAKLQSKLDGLNISPGAGSTSGNSDKEKQAEKLRKQIQEIQEKLLAGGGRRQYDLPTVDGSGSDDAVGGNSSYDGYSDVGDETPTAPTAITGPEINQQIRFRNNFVQPVEVDGILRKPVRLSTIISWMKKWAEWRFCDGLNRLYENIKQRPRSEFSQIKGMIHKLTMIRATEVPFLKTLSNVRYAKMLPSIAFFNDGELLGCKSITYDEETFNLPPALLKFPDIDELLNFRFGTIRRPLIGQASALTDSHVICIDNQVGLQLQYKHSGAGDDGVYNVGNEKYKIPQRKLFEICCLMHMYKRQKARYISIFDPTVVLDMAISLLSREYGNDTHVYKPWFNYEMDSVKTLLDMPKREIVHAIYKACWDLDLTETRVESSGATITDGQTLINYHRLGDNLNPKRKRYRPAALGATRGDTRRVRRLIYEDAIRQMKNRYTTLIREWGNVGSNDGQSVLDEWGLRKGDVSIRGTRDDTEQQAVLMEENVNNQDEIARPLFELERIDMVFSEPEIQRLVDALQQDINRVNGVAATNGVNLILPTGTLAQNIYTALFTQKLRGVKRGQITRTYNDDDRYEVTWHIPTDVLDGRNNLNHMTVLTKNEIEINHRRVGAFLFSQISRWKEPFLFAETKIVEELRAGNRLPIDVENLRILFKKCTEPYTIAIDIDGAAVIDETMTVYSKMKYYIGEFQRIIELKNVDRACNGKYQDPRFTDEGEYIQGQAQLDIANQPIRGLSISKEINRMLDNMENSLFEVNSNREDRCVQRNCAFVGGKAWKIVEEEE